MFWYSHLGPDKEAIGKSAELKDVVRAVRSSGNRESISAEH